MPTATAVAHPNIALCKYWGKRDRALNLPATPSFSLTVAPFHTRTTVIWGAESDGLELNGNPAASDESRKVLLALDRLVPGRPPCFVRSSNDFPTAAGLASSSSGFAALMLAASSAAGLQLPVAELAVHARRASGSATRSLQGGWVEWPMGTRADGTDSHGIPVADADWWDVRMVVAIVGAGRKGLSSTDGMVHTEATSPYFPAWVDNAEADVREAVAAVQARDLGVLGPIVERSSLRMHASMFAADPAVIYWKPATLACLEVVRGLRGLGVEAWATMDAGPNVKVLCPGESAERVAIALRDVVARVEILAPGGPARLLP